MALSTNVASYGKNFARFSAFLSNELREKSSFHRSSSKRKYSQKVQTPVPVKSAIVKELNKPLVLEEDGPGQKLKPGQVRIKVHCCAINVTDILLWSGLSEVKPKIPFVPGFEVSGEVIEIAADKSAPEESDCSDNEDALQVGDRVLALNKDTLNGFSTECIAFQKDTFAIPSSISYRTAAALADSYGTALLGISRRARVQKNDTVLVTAAAGGLGLAAVDIAANVYKAKVIGVCSTEDRATLVRDKGAWAAFTFRSDKVLKDEVSKISQGRGANIIFEAVGGGLFKSAMQCVAVEGKVVVAGFTSRDVPELPMSEFIQLPSFSLIGVSLSNYRNKMLSVYRSTISDTIEMCEQGLISPHISEVFQLENVNEAINYVKDQKSTGKVILEVVQT